MKHATHWLAAIALALAMSVVWGDDEAAQANADSLADAIASAQAAALACEEEPPCRP